MSVIESVSVVSISVPSTPGVSTSQIYNFSYASLFAKSQIITVVIFVVLYCTDVSNNSLSGSQFQIAFKILVFPTVVNPRKGQTKWYFGSNSPANLLSSFSFSIVYSVRIFLSRLNLSIAFPIPRKFVLSRCSMLETYESCLFYYRSIYFFTFRFWKSKENYEALFPKYNLYI